MNALVQARSISIDRNPVDLEFLVPRWSIEIHTFVASWAKFGPSLENVAMLTSLLLFGEAHAIVVTSI